MNWDTVITSTNIDTANRLTWQPVTTTTYTIDPEVACNFHNPYRIITGTEFVELCKNLAELFKEHFENADFDFDEDEFWKIWEG